MKKRVLVRGPALSRSGYGEQCRFALRALRAHEDRFDIHLINTGWGQSGWIHEDNAERAWIDDTIFKTIKFIQSPSEPFDVSLQVTIPNEWKLLARKNVAYTAGVETDTVPQLWREPVDGVDKIVVTSEHTKNSFLASGLGTEEKFAVINYPIRCNENAKIDMPLEYDFNFLTVAQWSPRKNIEATITSFLEEFTNEEVGLIVKTNIKNSSRIDREFCEDRLSFILNHFPEDRKCKVYLLHGNLTEEEMAGLYQHQNVKAYVSTSHGEGFGLPAFEAVCNGLPVISPNWGGIRDFCNIPVKNKKGKKIKHKPMIGEISFQVEPVQEEAVWEGVIEPTAKWCFPELDSVRKKMREAVNKPSTARAKKLQAYVLENFTIEASYKKFADAIYNSCINSKGETNEVE